MDIGNGLIRRYLVLLFIVNMPLVLFRSLQGKKNCNQFLLARQIELDPNETSVII